MPKEKPMRAFKVSSKLWRGSALVALCACGLNDDSDAFRQGLPTSEAVTIRLPGSSGTTQGLAILGGGGEARQAQGEKSALYTITRAATLTVNGGTVYALGVLKAIVDQPPTSVNGNVAIWGPHTDSLSPNTWRLTVTRDAPDHFTYALEGKGKTEGDSSYRKVFFGTHVPVLDAGGTPEEGFGTGEFTLDWNQEATLPEHSGGAGTAAIQYSRESLAEGVSVNANFTAFKPDAASEPVSGKYEYQETPDSGGFFSFSRSASVAGTSVAELLSIHSRWKAQGAGRSDVKASGGDLTAAATLSECWDSNFLSRYLVTTIPGVQSYGDPNADCAFTAASFATE